MRSEAEIEKHSRQLNAFESFSSLQAAVFESEQHLELLDGLRSVCWKIFLLFRDLDQQTWHTSLTSSRSAYESLRSHYLRAIENPDEVDSAADPLSENVESPWTVLRKDEVIRQEIFQDIERCMPENTYFRQPETQNMLLDILFIYTKLNPDVGYRQGMHELLAPIVWVVERDSTQEDGMGGLLDPGYIEHDTFTLFAQIMRTAKSFYDPGHPSQPTRAGRRPVDNESAMLVRSRRIFSHLLPQYDPGLYAHLEELDISPQLFLMRWIRLLFGREFSFNETLQVWDLLFAEDPSLELVDYICVAMILRIRWQLMKSDSNEALMLLMRYPSPVEPYGPRTLVLDARYLKANQDINGANDLIKNYSNRVPQPFKGRPARPITPDISISPDKITSKSNRARSPFVSPGVPSAFESLINDAARGVVSRGEKWGLNQTLRDAVGEVKKNVQNLQSGRASPLIGSPSFHRTTKSSEVTGNIAAGVLRKINALEERNRQLAKMLEDAVADLWAYEKVAADKKDGEDESLQNLSMAVAKVQFVQVFLQDSTLPLPQEERQQKPAEGISEKQEEIVESAPSASSEPLPNATAPDSQSKPAPTKPSIIAPSPIPISIRPPPANTPFQSLPTTSISTQHASATPTSSLTPSNHASLGRPRLEQSNFSWMLGQAHEDRAAFVNALPFSPGESRRDKAFLFGEGEDDVVGEPKVVEKGKGKKLRKNSKVAEDALRVRQHEDIGLGDMNGGGGGPI